ncbi:Pentatricopeptide repeat-containing protein [Pseudocercospora fuligena]|uniref:Pentatricopeptide repeat-containing protein n=1 Tax=Pseudocercospora fuligena TaxID=685502 RepID=A0A8H6RU55_9PEZI|nr:Pentatricopeptide repeat-containing protein [Pseudocercospora fuligena]
MLERAGACLKAGARDSLKCASAAKKAARSQRQLHQTFWSHGAGDLGLPPYAISTTPPHDLPLRHGSTTARSKRLARDQKSETSHLPPDGVYLDFLYPPQALAWASRVNGQLKEPWEKRNARRLPEGFGQASRRYSSRPRSRRVTVHGPISPGDAEDQAESNKIGLVELSGGIDPEHNGQERNTWAKHVASEDAMGDLLQWRTKISGFDPLPEKFLDDTSPAISAAELADHSTSRQSIETARHPEEEARLEELASAHSGSESAQDRLIRLRRTLATNALKASSELVDHTWKLYLSLTSDDRDDLRLKERFLSWLSEVQSTDVLAYIITLLWSIPLENRTLPLYQSACQVVLNSESFSDIAITLHDEAVSHLANVSQLSSSIFAIVMQRDLWHLALRIFKASESQSDPRQHGLFLVKIAEHDNLDVAYGLTTHLKPMSEDERQSWLPMWAHIAKEACQQALQDRVPAALKTKTHCLYSISHRLSQWVPEQTHFFEKLLAHRLNLLDEYLHSYALASRDNWSSSIISHLYRCYREMPNAKLNEDLLLILLKMCGHRAHYKHADIETSRNVAIGLVVNDWQRWYGKLRLDAVHRLLSLAAQDARKDQVESWFQYLERNYSRYEDQKDAYWTRIHVHARASDLASARTAFEKARAAAKSHSDELDLECWNSLLKAYARFDDLDGALSLLKTAVHDVGLVPTRATFDPVLRMLNKRGDVPGTEDLIEQFYDLTGDPAQAWLAESHINALCIARQPQKAEEAMKDAVRRFREGEMRDSVTGCCNALLAYHAKLHNIDAVMSTYRWMKSKGIRLNGKSYVYLLQALVAFRQASAAWLIVKTVMKNEGCPATAAHYDTVMIGYMDTGEYERAIRVYKKMIANNVRPGARSKANYIKAKTLQEARNQDRSAPQQSLQVENRSLPKAMKELHRIVGKLSDRDLSTSGSHGLSSADNIGDMFASIIWTHGARGCLEEAKSLFEQSQKFMQKLGRTQTPSFRLHAGLMNALLHAGEYEQVEAYWRVVKDQADRVAPLSAVPELRRSQNEEPKKELVEPSTEHAFRLNAPVVESASPDDRAELGFSADAKPAQEAKAMPDVAMRPTTGPNGASSLGPRPAPGRRHILTRPFALYIAALKAQGRIADMVREFTRLVTQGYTFDGVLWNRFIEYLCSAANPPLALLAFTLTERYFISNFPGWRPDVIVSRHGSYRGERAENMQFMKRRYFAPEQLAPQYRTMLNLGRALIDIQRLEATGWTPDSVNFTPLTDSSNVEVQKLAQSLRRFVGTEKQIREKAPRTVEAVETMPRVDIEKWQRRILRSEGWPKGAPSRGKDDFIRRVTSERHAEREEEEDDEDATEVPMRKIAVASLEPEHEQAMIENDDGYFAKHVDGETLDAAGSEEEPDNIDGRAEKRK